MSIFAAFLNALIFPVTAFLHYYGVVILIAVILSWLEAFNILNTSNRFVDTVCTIIHKLTDPYLNFFRNIIPPTGNIDLSPIIGIFALYFLQGFIPRLLVIMANAVA